MGNRCYFVIPNSWLKSVYYVDLANQNGDDLIYVRFYNMAIIAINEAAYTTELCTQPHLNCRLPYITS